MSLRQLIRDPQVVLSLAVEELAPQVFKAITANLRLQNGMFNRQDISRLAREYPQQQDDVEIAIIEAWRWLEIHMFILPAPGSNGQNGYFVPGRRGRDALADPRKITSYTKASLFPRELLYPAIVERVWAALARGEYDIAVFSAFKAVEEAVREAGGYSSTDIGTELMRKAFAADSGPLAKQSDPKPEREALAHLFAGAIGSYKNPHSHRTVTITDASEAQEMVMLASHLLRIVETRRPRDAKS
jgi:uncharacterized protein (TIGR02391 family)